MGVVGLAWYITALCALLTLMTSAISWAPSSEFIAVVLTLAFAGGTVIAIITAIGLGMLPRTHRIRQSRSLWTAFAVAAATVTALAVLIG